MVQRHETFVGPFPMVKDKGNIQHFPDSVKRILARKQILQEDESPAEELLELPDVASAEALMELQNGS